RDKKVKSRILTRELVPKSAWGSRFRSSLDSESQVKGWGWKSDPESGSILRSGPRLRHGVRNLKLSLKSDLNLGLGRDSRIGESDLKLRPGLG
ncbi:hypothetical protein HAX54_012431, partial [Datura stramonium]|nr:hypothetical protein [Datura stramonium]